MKRTNPANTLAILFLSMLVVADVSAQAAGSVTGRVFTSTDAPPLRLKLEKKLKFVGSHDFALYDRAKAEQFFFVEVEGKTIKRLLMLQFESFLPDAEGKYDYNEPHSAEIGGRRYFSNSETIPDVEAALKALPGSDIAKAADFLRNKGFKPMKSLKYQRFVRVLDDLKRSEFIILYVEDAADSVDVTDLQKRALAAFTVLK